ncbi:MAG: hypothetical protein ACYC7F_02240 [Gemmatimonadaceae bacterium]
MTTIVGVAWYSRSTWTQLRETAPDGASLEVTYEAWLNVFEDGLAKLRAAGVTPQRIEVDLRVFTEWCESVGRVPDSAARAAFVSEQLRRRDGLAPSSED